MPKKVDLTGTIIDFTSSSVKLLRKLSETLTSQVYLTDQETIVKFIDLSKPQCFSYFFREIPVYQLMSPHPNITGYIDHVVLNNKAFLHLEFYSKGDYNYIMAMNRLSYSDIREVIIDVCMALDDLHSKGITHMDLRAENILLSNEGVSKLCDFGSALRAEVTNDLIENGKLGEFLTTYTAISMRPPEFAGPVSIEPSIDIWQVGCLLYTLVYYKPPFPYGYVLPAFLEDCPKVFKPTLEKLLNPNPELRPSAREVIEMLLPTPILGGILAERRVTFIEKMIARSTKQLVNKATGDSEESVPIKIIERIVYKGLKKPFKIVKFVECIEEKNIENIFQCIKILHLLHIYMYKVPIVIELHKDRIKRILINIIFTWNIKSAEAPLFADFKYVSCFVKQYATLLGKKIGLFENHKIQCNWSNYSIKFESFEEVLSYYEFCLYLVLGLTFETVQAMKSIKQEIIKAISNEISIVVLILSKSFSTNAQTGNVWFSKFKKLHAQTKLLFEKKKILIFLASVPKEGVSKVNKYELSQTNVNSLSSVIRNLPIKPSTSYSNLID